MTDAAGDYMARGLRVIALTGKTPNVRVHTHGPKDGMDETADTALVAAAFGHPDTTGIGILTSWPLIVVDIDGEVGAQNWLSLVGQADYLPPDCWVAKTGRGFHLYMTNIEPTGSMKLAPLLDLKGEGGYVAAPPSLHPDGHRYEWLIAPGEAMTGEAPEALQARIHDHNFDAERRQVSSTMNRLIRHEPLEGGILYASWGFDSLIEGMANAADGNRNNYLHWAARTMAEEGALDEEFEQLRAAARANGLMALEVRRTIRSARRLNAGE